MIFVSFTLVARGTEFYVAPNGSASGDGSSARPWNLATGLGQPASVRPGDTIWLRGGRYTFPPGGNVLIGLRGTAAAPIKVAQYPGERATLDIRGAAQGLVFTNSPNPSGAAYVDFRNFEVTNSDTNRTPGMPVPIYVRTSDHLKFINLIVHDTGEGFSLNPEATNTEVYGCLVYYNGALSGREHGIYVQNISGYKKVIDNIIFNNAGYGIHAYPHADDSALLNVSLVGNISFNNGLLGGLAPQPDLLLGGEAVAISPVISNNSTYKSAGDLWNQQIGYGAGCRFPRVTNNYFVGTTAFTDCTRDLVLSGNTFNGRTGVVSNESGSRFVSFVGRLRRLAARLGVRSASSGLDPAMFPNNRFQDRPSKGKFILLRPNQYEPGRANIAIYNWDHSPFVDFDPRPILRRGDRYQLRSAQNFFDQPALEGTYNGNPLRIPMMGLPVAPPIGLVVPSSPGPEFRSFVLLRLGGSP